jgi:hypothetical protein
MTGQPAARAEAVSPPGHREGQREVRCAEHGHGAQRHVAQAQVRTRQRLAVRHGRVDAGFQEAAVAQHAGEQPQLAGGATPLAFQARARQAGLGHDPDDQVIADRLDVLGDGFQEGGAGLVGQDR